MAIELVRRKNDQGNQVAMALGEWRDVDFNGLER
jgi:hypothetical protein